MMGNKRQDSEFSMEASIDVSRCPGTHLISSADALIFRHFLVLNNNSHP